MKAASQLAGVEHICDLLSGRRVAVLTGAGCSTESGIPDYRGPSSGPRVRKPIQYQDFMRSEATRSRYWSRSVIGWQRVATARPNPGHHALAQLEDHGIVRGVITQNVDGLHYAAGSRHVVELHGSLSAVRCMSCGAKTARADYQQRLLALNHEWAARVQVGELEIAPDGDVEIETSGLQDFQVPACTCGGILKPDVVFFGENVPAPVVEQAWQLFDQCDALLVVGSSLTVFSGRRFVYRATERGIPIAIVNIGPTRADDVATVKIDAPIGVALPEITRVLL